MDLDRKTVRRGLRQTEWRPYERGDADREDAGGGRGAGRDERTGTLNRVSRRPFLRIRSRRYRSEFCRGAAGQSGQSLSTAPPPLWPLRGSPPGCAARHRPPGFVSGRWGNGPAGGLRLDDAGGRGDRAGLDADGADRTVEGRGERVDVGRQTPGPARGRCGRAFPGRTGEEAPASRPSRALPHVPPEPRRAQPVVVQHLPEPHRQLTPAATPQLVRRRRQTKGVTLAPGPGAAEPAVCIGVTLT